MKVSVIIPVYNEGKVIANCLASLSEQTINDLEIIVVDDGSIDQTGSVVSSQKSVVLLSQKHLGPGAARNVGAQKAKGDILVFVDADMEFEDNFIERLIAPIVSSKAIGTYSKEEYLLNKNNKWARYWNINLGRKVDKMEPRDFATPPNTLYALGKNLLERIEKKETNLQKDRSHVFRAISKKEFLRAGGFNTNSGYTDDWSVSEKLGIMSVLAPGAKFYHRNPESLIEVWRQARWFGKNEFLTKNLIRKLYNLFRYCPLWAFARVYDFDYFLFKVVYNSAVFTSVLFSFFGEQKYK